jgi:YD repeat-containing protein
LGEALRDVCYDEASRIVGFTHLSADGTAQPALDQAFGWDENSRLTSITTATSSWSISCDPNGNRARIPRAASRWCFIRTDHLSTPRVVVDRRNRVRWRRLADPFGMAAPETNPRGLGVFPEKPGFCIFSAPFVQTLDPLHNHQGADRCHRTNDPTRSAADPPG